VGRLSMRLSALEGRLGSQPPRPRCVLCEDLPDVAVLWPEQPAPTLRCIGCGWEPSTLIEVVYEERPWRAA
jgi:hypothetical protein